MIEFSVFKQYIHSFLYQKMLNVHVSSNAVNNPKKNFLQLEPRPNEAVMRVVPDNECEGFFLGGAHNYTSSNVCLKGTKLRVVACQGDSGGPISCSPTGRHTLYGIVSRGPSCGSIIAPEIDTRITKYIHWILEKIRN